MEKFFRLKYLKIIIPIILLVCFAFTAAVGAYFKSSRTYTASAVIRFNDSSAEKGKTPLGTDLNVNEIKSSSVISRVLGMLGLDGIYSVDSLISRITITEVPDPDKEAQKVAKLDEGEEFIYVPDTYIVAFTATNAEGAGFATEVLDETLDIYFGDYSKNYVNVETINDNLSKIYDESYDYIETMELINNNLEATINSLYQRSSADKAFRSAKTGMSFNDLLNEFNFLKNVETADLFADIFRYQITKSKPLLVSNYLTRIDNNTVTAAAERSNISDILEIIDDYVTKMRESGNTDIDYNYILSDVYDRGLFDDSAADQTVTYDTLIYGWQSHNEALEYALIDTEYSNYIINAFTSCTGSCPASACTDSSLTCTELSKPGYSSIRENIEARIKALTDELERLYSLTTDTNNEYNEYLGSKYISVLSTISVGSSINVKLYTIIAFIFIFAVCLVITVFIARASDIIDYVYYTDHLTGMMNHSYFDKFLASKDGKLIDDGTAIASVMITNQREINEKFGRHEGDEVIALFAAGLKSAFSKTGAQLIYNGNSHFFIYVEKTDYITVDDIMGLFSSLLEDRMSCESIEIKYTLGISESFHSKVHTARQLLRAALENKTEFILASHDKRSDGNAK